MLLEMAVVEFLLVPLAQGLRDEVIQRISASVLDSSRGRVSAWLSAFAGGEPTDRAALRDELAADPELGPAIRQAIGSLPGMPQLPQTGGDVPTNATALTLDGYAEVLYQFALSAIWTGRPVAINGFLQGAEWIAVCQSQAGGGMLAYQEGGRRVFPDPAAIWKRDSAGASPVLRRTPSYEGGSDELEFRVRHVADAEQRAREVAELERRWRMQPDAVLPARPARLWRDSPPDPFAERWHEVTEIHPWVVALPAAPLRDFAPDAGEDVLRSYKQRSEPERPLRPLDYPDDVRAFVDIADDPGAAIARVRRGAFAVVSADHELRAKVRAALAV